MLYGHGFGNKGESSIMKHPLLYMSEMESFKFLGLGNCIQTWTSQIIGYQILDKLEMV